MKLNRIISTTFAAVTALAFTAPVIAADFAWDMPNEYGEKSVTGESDKVFAERLKKNSNGRIVITNHFGGSLGYKSKDHWSAVEDGAVPIASTYTGVFAGFDPIFLLNNMPFMATNPVQSRTLLDAAKPWYQKAFAKSNQMLLLTEPWTPVGIWSKKRINSGAEMKDLRIRTYDKNGTITLKNIGAAAIQMSWADVVPALSTNTIEAVLTSAEGGLSAKFYDYLNHFHYVNFTMGSNMVHINKKTFEDMPADLQKVVLDTAKEVEDELWSRIQARMDGNVQRLIDNGVKPINDVPAAFIDELKVAGKAAIDEWRQKLGAAEADKVVGAYQDLLKTRQ